MSPTVEEQLDVLRRVAERGLALAETDLQVNASDFIDIFVHLLDEIDNTKRACSSTSEQRSSKPRVVG